MVRMSCTVMRLGCLRLGMSSPDLVQDRENAVTVQTMTNRVQGLPKLSGNYRNPCPGFTETRVRELLKSVSGNLRNPHEVFGLLLAVVQFVPDGLCGLVCQHYQLCR